MTYDDTWAEFYFNVYPLPDLNYPSEAQLIDAALTTAYPDESLTGEVRETIDAYDQAAIIPNDDNPAPLSVRVLRRQLRLVDAALEYLSQDRTMRASFLGASVDSENEEQYRDNFVRAIALSTGAAVLRRTIQPVVL